MLQVIKQEKIAFPAAVTWRQRFMEGKKKKKKKRGNSINMDICGQNHSEIEEMISSHVF